MSVAGTAGSTTQPPDNAALIGGIVGAVVALLLVGILIAFLVVRSRRNANHQDNSATASTTAASAESNYDRIPTKISDYSDHVGVDESPRNHYDALTPNEL
jgi:predicted permease